MKNVTNIIIFNSNCYQSAASMVWNKSIQIGETGLNCKILIILYLNGEKAVMCEQFFFRDPFRKAYYNNVHYEIEGNNKLHC